MKKIEVVRSSLPLWIRIIISVLLTAVLVVSAVFFGTELYVRPREWQSFLWILASGWAVTYVIQMFFNSPVRRLLVRMLKGLLSIGRWNAESWLLQAFLWFSVCTYGLAIVVIITFIYSPVSLADFAVRG